MKKLTKTFYRSIVIAFTVILSACATVDDVNRASTLNRLDTNLPVLIQKIAAGESHETELAKAELRQIVDESNRLALVANGSDPLRKAQAIGFYRIAATAAWKSEAKDAISNVFAASNKGRTICASMDAFRPDRDCFYLLIVPTYVATEDALNAPELQLIHDPKYLDQLKAGNFTDEAKGVYKPALDALNFIRLNLFEGKVISAQDEKMLDGHPALKSYYCGQIENVVNPYNEFKNAFFLALNSYVDTKKIEGQTEALEEPLKLSDKALMEINNFDGKLPEICD